MEYKIKVRFYQYSSKIGELTLGGFFNELAYTLDKNSVSEIEKLGLTSEEVERFQLVADQDNMIARGYTAEDTPHFFEPYKMIDTSAWIDFYKKVKLGLQTYDGKMTHFSSQNSRSPSIDLISELLAVLEMAQTNNYNIVCTLYVS